MKLVNVHKRILIFILFIIGINSAKAQIWSLKQCLDSAMLHNKNLKISRNNLLSGDEKVMESKANLLPKLVASADYKYYSNLPYQLMPLSTFNTQAPEGTFKEVQFGVPHNINANFQIAIPLYNPQLYGAYDAAKIASKLNLIQNKITEEHIFFEIAVLYYNAQILKHQLEFVDSNIRNSNILLRNMQLLNEQLLAKGTDVSKIRLKVLQLSTQREAINSKYEQVLNAMKFSMGISLETNFTVELKIEFHKIKDETSSNSYDLELLKTKKGLLSSEINTLNKSRYLPTLNMFGNYGTIGLGYDKKPNNFLKFYPLGFAGFQLSYSLFNGTITQRKINQKKIEIRNNELQLSLVSEQNNIQVKNAKEQKLLSLKSIETLNEQIKLAETIYKQTLLQLNEGTAAISDVLLADNELRETQQTYLSAIIEYLKADLELKRLTGNLTIKN